MIKTTKSICVSRDKRKSSMGNSTIKDQPQDQSRSVYRRDLDGVLVTDPNFHEGHWSRVFKNKRHYNYTGSQLETRVLSGSGYERNSSV